VMSRTLEHAAELAQKLGGTAVSLEERWQHMSQADVIISSTACPHTILSREDTERLVRGREKQPLVIVDIAMPRDIDPEIRHVKGAFLYDLDDLENVVSHNVSEREAAAAAAEKILRSEAQSFRRDLVVQRVVPTIVALRQRLNEICRQELDSFSQENGPFTQDQNETLIAVMSRVTQRKGGTGPDDSRRKAAVPSRNAGHGACRYQIAIRRRQGTNAEKSRRLEKNVYSESNIRSRSRLDQHPGLPARHILLGFRSRSRLSVSRFSPCCRSCFDFDGL